MLPRGRHNRTDIIGIDLGATTGIFVFGNVIKGIEVKLTGKKTEGPGVRFFNFRNRLGQLQSSFEPAAICYELIIGHKSTFAAQQYGGYVAILMGFCETHGIPYAGVHASTLKKASTGDGRADKDAMIAAARAWSNIEIGDKEDNLADAVLTARYALVMRDKLEWHPHLPVWM